jgi:hypothetical protein
VFYELHVTAFQDASQDGAGDFGGLVQRVDHVASPGLARRANQVSNPPREVSLVDD